MNGYQMPRHAGTPTFGRMFRSSSRDETSKSSITDVGRGTSFRSQKHFATSRSASACDHAVTPHRYGSRQPCESVAGNSIQYRMRLLVTREMLPDLDMEPFTSSRS